MKDMLNIILAVIMGCIGGLIFADVVDLVQEHFGNEIYYIEE